MKILLKHINLTLLTTLNEKHNLPFNLTIDSINDYLDLERRLD